MRQNKASLHSLSFLRIGRSFSLNILILASTLLTLPFSANAGLFGGKFKAEVETEQVAIKLHNETLAGNYQLIDTNGLKALTEQDTDVMIVDAMPFKDSYKKEHIPNAMQFEFPIPNMPEWDSALTDQKSVEDFTQLLGEDKSKTLVFYCGFVKCSRSHNAAAWAVKLGYTNVYRYPGGIFAWKGAGFKTASL
ncbi:rhodanese-like domain-containing protein [Photobacterium sanguinicancri]|uniref:rhodanese-like domain-containing protein n=1 Tax=Photobacterium sanguinicancri TaxID=875932 RepID=UPI0026E3FAD3|nr:rhodanese-like domain-containing protein [Photobacterium sanguinicancri]MDO6497073.1 rhodanese-like domain-containing protein [Photobacterium sanguinicancri]